MTFREAAPRQRVYILRFWETRSLPPDAPVTWRFSAQDPRTGERRGFADLDGLMAFLAAQTGERAGSGRAGSLAGPGTGHDPELADRRAADSENRPVPPRHSATAARRRPADPGPASSSEQTASMDLVADR